jgi:thiamine-phosphate diphosphorylase
VIGFVTDRRRGADSSPAYLLDRIRAAAAAGVDWIQVRERDLCDRDRLALVRVAVDIVRGTATRILVNDRVDIALAAGAAGVQLRGDSPDAARVRAIVPPGFLIGRSMHAHDDLALARDCDFVLFGTVFASAGKPPDHPVTGVEVLRQLCARSAVPVLAIGGIDEANAHQIAAAGAAGIAAVGIFMVDRSSAELAAAVRAMRAAFAS